MGVHDDSTAIGSQRDEVVEVGQVGRWWHPLSKHCSVMAVHWLNPALAACHAGLACGPRREKSS